MRSSLLKPMPHCPLYHQGPEGLALLEDLGRLLLLDMLLGNADRLPFPELGWRGNPSNVILGAPGVGVTLLGFREGET